MLSLSPLPSRLLLRHARARVLSPSLCYPVARHRALHTAPPPQMSASDSDSDGAPRKRARHSAAPSDASTSGNGGGRPPLSLSILGVEPIDEFIREVADFVHHMIVTRPQDLRGAVEVEAKIGVLRDKQSGQRIQLPVLVETRACVPELCAPCCLSDA
jgi:hypothetical protein